ncbi:MAG TPA: response regulator transcription factor [Chloroflexota bacterium]|nr:response regulator transcription factor [Chloroflexota bacterium]
MDTTDGIRILIADDHPLFRDGLRVLLDSVGGMTVVGEATTGDETITLATELQPDIVLMDIKMPGLNGIEATRRIVTSSPSIAVLMVTMFEDDDSVFAAMRAGAKGYLLKGARQDETLRAISAVANGEAIFSPGVAQRVLQYFSASRTTSAPPVEPVEPAQLLPELTEREQAVLTLLAERCSNADIAQRLYLSPKTVRNYVSNIFSKLQVATRAEAMLRAREAGMGANGRAPVRRPDAQPNTRP